MTQDKQTLNTSMTGLEEAGGGGVCGEVFGDATTTTGDI